MKYTKPSIRKTTGGRSSGTATGKRAISHSSSVRPGEQKARAKAFFTCPFQGKGVLHLPFPGVLEPGLEREHIAQQGQGNHRHDGGDGQEQDPEAPLLPEGKKGVPRRHSPQGQHQQAQGRTPLEVGPEGVQDTLLLQR